MMDLTKLEAIIIKGQRFEMEVALRTFGEKRIVYMLDKQYAKPVLKEEDPIQKLIEQIDQELEGDDLLDEIIDDEEREFKNKRKEVASNSLLHEEIKLLFHSKLKAENDAIYYAEKLGLDYVPEVKEVKEGYVVVFNDITEKELDFINRKVKTEDTVEFLVGTTSKVVETTADLVDFTAKNVFVPTAKVATVAGVKTAKTLTNTTVKAGANLINATAQAVKESKRELSVDKDLLTAKRELKGALKGIKGLFGIRNKSSRFI